MVSFIQGLLKKHQGGGDEAKVAGRGGGDGGDDDDDDAEDEGSAGRLVMRLIKWAKWLKEVSHPEADRGILPQRGGLMRDDDFSHDFRQFSFLIYPSFPSSLLVPV